MRPSAEECGRVATVPFFLRWKAFCDSRLLLALCKSISTGVGHFSQLILGPVAAGCSVQRPFRASPAKYRTVLSEPHVRFEAHCGLDSDIAPCPKLADFVAKVS